MIVSNNNKNDAEKSTADKFVVIPYLSPVKDQESINPLSLALLRLGFFSDFLNSPLINSLNNIH